MLCDYLYVLDWEIIENGKIIERTFLDKEEYEEFLKLIIGNKRYKLLETYKLDLEEL